MWKVFELHRRKSWRNHKVVVVLAKNDRSLHLEKKGQRKKSERRVNIDIDKAGVTEGGEVNESKSNVATNLEISTDIGERYEVDAG